MYVHSNFVLLHRDCDMRLRLTKGNVFGEEPQALFRFSIASSTFSQLQRNIMLHKK